jgi:valyl-tRNA synthetase
VVNIATAVRRYKTKHQLHMGAELERLQIATRDAALGKELREANADIRSITRAKQVEVREHLDDDLEIIGDTGTVAVALVQ